MVTDWDSWRDDRAGVEAADIMAVMRANAERAHKALATLAKLLPAERSPVPADTALDGAIITAPEQRDRALAARLDAVAGRVLG
jgi:5'-methylthioadenosine phosphorylase